jgi:hypothetical protein
MRKVFKNYVMEYHNKKYSKDYKMSKNGVKNLWINMLNLKKIL